MGLGWQELLVIVILFLVPIVPVAVIVVVVLVSKSKGATIQCPPARWNDQASGENLPLLRIHLAGRFGPQQDL